jgi:hypothetical protein
MFDIVKWVLGLDDARKFFAEEATGSLSSLHRGLGPRIDECNAIGILIRQSLKAIKKAMKAENEVRRTIKFNTFCTTDRSFRRQRSTFLQVHT